MTNWIEAVTGSLEQKKQYRHLKARMDGLSEPYRTAATALHRYLVHYGGVVDGDTTVAMMNDLVELWERAAADAVSVRSIVGDEPVEFAETFARSYGGAHWIDKERARLNDAIAAADHATTTETEP